MTDSRQPWRGALAGGNQASASCFGSSCCSLAGCAGCTRRLRRGVSARDHGAEHYSAHENEDNKEREHSEHASAKREHDRESRDGEARADDQRGIEKRSAVLTARRRI